MLSLDLFQYDFMIRAFIAGSLIGLIAPLIGSFLVVRRYSLMADTLAHVSLLGIAIGLLLNLNPIIAAVLTCLVAAFGIERLRERKGLYGESILALFLTGSLALAIVIMSANRDLNVNLLSYLFGSITTVSPTDVWIIVGLGILVLATIALTFRALFTVSFDEEFAKVSGLPTRWLNIILVVLTALTVALALRIVGALLIGALMVIPVLTAMQYQQNFRRTIQLAILFSLVSVIGGLLSSYYLNLASGGTIVVIALILFGISLLARPSR